MRFNNKFILASATMIGMVVSSVAYGASVTFNDLGASFHDASGGANVQYGGSNDPATVTWGTGGTSGYEYNSTDAPFTRNIDTLFSLGEFTHKNQPIDSGTGIDSVELTLTSNISFTDDSNVTINLGAKLFEFLVKHDETPNTGRGCCADIVSITTLNSTGTFMVGLDVYTLNILGFAKNATDAANGIYSSLFSSPEKGTNNRILMGSFSVFEGQEPNPVPLPASLPLLLAGLAGFGVLRRRK